MYMILFSVRPPQVTLSEGQQACVVCGDVGNGIHFGAVTCEGCKVRAFIPVAWRDAGWSRALSSMLPLNHSSPHFYTTDIIRHNWSDCKHILWPPALCLWANVLNCCMTQLIFIYYSASLSKFNSLCYYINSGADVRNLWVNQLEAYTVCLICPCIVFISVTRL